MAAALSVLSLVEFVLFSVLFRFAMKDWVTTAVLVVISVGWVASMAIALATVRYKTSVAVLVVAPTVIIIALSKLSVIAIGGAALLGIFTLMAQRTFTREMHNRIRYRTTEIFGVGLRLLTLGFMIGLLGLSWSSFTGEGSVYRFQVAEQQLAPLMKPLEPIVRNFLPTFRSDLTVDQFIQQEIEKQTNQLPPGVTLPPGQLAQSRAELSQRFGEQLSGQETLTTLVTHRINNSIGALAEENVLLVTLVLIIIAFLTLRALLPLLVWPLLGIVALLVLALRAIGLLHIQDTQVTVERLSL